MEKLVLYIDLARNRPGHHENRCTSYSTAEVAKISMYGSWTGKRSREHDAKPYLYVGKHLLYFNVVRSFVKEKRHGTRPSKVRGKIRAVISVSILVVNLKQALVNVVIAP